ncbi:MAG TPA: DUF1254 domain-containing protein [Rhizomicrobium sp.]|jgi:uncharacterized membrane protein
MLRKLLPWIAATLLVAAVVHVATVWLLPRAIMHRVITRMAVLGLNEIRFQNRPDASVRGVVRPSPDLLYSICAFDLSAGPLRVRSPVPGDTYWSVSLFDNATNNFYVLDDQQAHATHQSTADFVIAPQGSPATLDGLKTVAAPSTQGLVLFRTLIDDDRKLAAIDALRRKARCAPLHKA